MKDGKIILNVQNNFNFDASISLFGSTSDPQAGSLNAVTEYWWDISFPFLNVANVGQMYIEAKRVGAPSFTQVYFTTSNTYNGLLQGLNSIGLGTFWYEFPTFLPLAGYQIYTTNDNLIFGNIGW
jgi:hypothetical protein